jgi:hypothetical protein
MQRTLLVYVAVIGVVPFDSEVLMNDHFRYSDRKRHSHSVSVQDSQTGHYSQDVPLRDEKIYNRRQELPFEVELLTFGEFLPPSRPHFVKVSNYIVKITV